MKKLFLIFILYVFIYCSNHDSNKEDSEILSNIKYCSSTRLLKIEDTLRITYSVPDSLSNYNIEFFCSSGDIVEQNDSSILYKAPAKPDSVFIIGYGIDENQDTVLYGRFKVLVYKQIIMLKGDEFDSDKWYWQWDPFLNFIKLEKIPVNIGIVGKSLDAPNIMYINYLKDLLKTGLVEFWNHGYNHVLMAERDDGSVYCEFKNTSVEYQIEHMRRTNTLIKEWLGIDVIAFGAPGNKIDENTIIAVDSIEQFKIWLYGFQQSKKIVLKRTANIEFPVFYPDFDKFLEEYSENYDYIVYQIHPMKYDEKRMEVIKKILLYLKNKEVTFLKLSDYFYLSHPQVDFEK